MWLLKIDFKMTKKNLYWNTEHAISNQIFILLASIFTSYIFGTGNIYKILPFYYIEVFSVYTIDMKHLHSVID